MRIRPVSPRSVAVLVGFAVLAIAIVSLHTYHFAGRAYRQDEAWVAQAAIVHAEQSGGTLGTVLSNITRFTSEYWLGDLWVPLFGHVEGVARFLSTLFTTLTLALVFRLGKDLFNAQVGLSAVFLLGTLAIFQFFSHELRPYAPLLAATTALLLLFERWLRYLRLRYALSYIAVAAATIYIHAFVVFVVAAQAVFFVLLVRWDRAIWRRTFGLLIVTGLLLLPRLYQSFLYYRGAQGGIEWYSLTTNWDALVILHAQMQIAPTAIGQLLLLLGLALPVAAAFPRSVTPGRAHFRFGVEWRKAYLVIPPLSILGMVFAANLVVRIATPRNLLIILPPLAVLAGYALLILPRPARAIIVILIAIPAVFSFEPFINNGPYFELIDFVRADFQPGDRFVAEGAQFWEHNSFAYYLRERLPQRVPNDALFHLTNDDAMGIVSLPDPPVHWASDASSASLAQFRAFLDHTRRIWYIQGSAVAFDASYRSILAETYIPYRTRTLGTEQGYAPHTFIEYRRIPDQFEDPYRFGDMFDLRHWELDRGVTIRPCETFTLESWWSVRMAPAVNYSMTLALVDASGMGVANNDSAPAGTLTQLWQPGQLFLDVRSLTIPCGAAAGDYALIINLYDYQTLATLPITGNDGAPRDTAYLTTLHVAQS